MLAVPYLYTSRETRGVSAGSSTAPEVDEFDQMDAEEREEATSGTSHIVSGREARAYLCAVLTARCDMYHSGFAVMPV